MAQADAQTGGSNARQQPLFSRAAIERSSDADFAVTWTSVQQDGQDVGNLGVFGQRFRAPLLDVDGNGDADALTDGLLVLRRMFGFIDTALTAGAVGPGCSRCTAEEIEAYLDLLGPLLDIDDDGENDPLTDGLLVLRDRFGFTDTALTTGAVDEENCGRCAAETLLEYLATLAP